MPYVTHLERRGKQEGMQEGMQVGEKKGEFKVLQRQLENRFGKLPAQYRKRLEAADSETLLRWSERVLTAQSIEEVFEEN